MRTYTFRTVAGGRAKINAGSGFFVPKSSPGIFENGDSVLINFRDEDDLIIYPANDTVIIDGVTHAAGSLGVTAMSDAINILFPKVGSGTTTTPSDTITNYISGEVLSGSVDGVNTVYTFAYPVATNKEMIFNNGVKQRRGVDYTMTNSTTATFTTAPATDASGTDYLEATYFKQ